jgi:TPR repeat protein
MTKINSAYQFLIHPLHKQEDRTHDRAKRVLSLVASIAAGVFSLGSAHLIVYALHKREIKKLNPPIKIREERTPSEQVSTHSSTPSSSISSKSSPSSSSSSSSKSPFSSSSSSSSSSTSFPGDEDDLKLAQKLQEQENLSRHRDEDLARRLQDEENQREPEASAGQVEPRVPEDDMDAAMALSRGEAEEAQNSDLERAKALSLQPDAAIPNLINDDLFHIYTTIESKLDREVLMTTCEELLKTAQSFEEIKEGIRYLAAAANKGHVEAMVQIASMFKFGTMPGIPVDTQLSRHYFLLAAERNNATAQAEYGELLEEGLGGPQQLQEAKQWYERSAQQNHPQGLFYLGSYIAEHEHDTAGAIRHYELAADQGYVPAQLALGITYFKGEHTARNIEKAEALFLSALKKQNAPTAHFYLGEIYERAEGKIDIQKAIQHYSMAAGNYIEAQERLNALIEANSPSNLEPKEDEGTS